MEAGGRVGGAKDRKQGRRLEKTADQSNGEVGELYYCCFPLNGENFPIPYLMYAYLIRKFPQ